MCEEYFIYFIIAMSREINILESDSGEKKDDMDIYIFITKRASEFSLFFWHLFCLQFNMKILVEVSTNWRFCMNFNQINHI